MGTESTTAKQRRLDERNHVVMPLIDQCMGLGRETNDFTDMKKTAADTALESLTDIVIPLLLPKRLTVIKWLEDIQVEEGVKQLAHE